MTSFRGGLSSRRLMSNVVVYVALVGVFTLPTFCLSAVAAGEIDYASVRWTTPVPAPGVINMGGDSYFNPSISEDGLTMYWDSTRELAVLGFGDQETCCIWTATRPSTADAWENPIPVDSPFKVPPIGLGGLVEPDITADGLELYFVLNFFPPITAMGGGPDETPDDELWVKRRGSVDEPWDEGTKLSDAVHSLGCVSDPSVTGDGLELYFDVGVADCDTQRIHVSKRASRDEPFGEPQLVVNNGLLPGISPNGLHLFFRTQGDVSLYVASRASREEEFGQANRLRSPLSNGDFSADLSGDGKTLYFTSFRGAFPGTFDEVWQTTIVEPCDFNADGSCDVDDLDVLIGEIAGGVKDTTDLTSWLSSASEKNGNIEPYLVGDANLDGSVNAIDLNNLGLNWQQNVALWSGGDFTADGRVNSADLNALGLNWQQSIPMASAASAAVPEPSSITLLLLGVCALVRRAHRARE